MELHFINHNYIYAAEQTMFTLYPGEKPIYPETDLGGDALWLTLEREGSIARGICRLRKDGQDVTAVKEVKIPDASDPTRGEQRALKQAFYAAALLAGHEKPAWGSLTGVRPAKFMKALMAKDGMTLEQAKAALTEEYDVSPARAELCTKATAVAEEVRCTLSEKDLCLYIGIPYCPSRCTYCSFISTSAPDSLNHIPEYLDALWREMKALAKAIRRMEGRIIAIYVGGGTPTTLSAPQLDMLISKIKEIFDLTYLREWTVEAGRPDTITEEKLQVLETQGIGRISINPQTMSDTILQSIGRHHTAAQIQEAMTMARGRFAINMDLIAGLPGDTPEGFADTLQKVLAMQPENITVHTLSLKRGSYFMENPAQLPTDEQVGQMLALAEEALEKHGYKPYYLYRQKYMSGSFENVGWTLPGHENLYNICIMEELCSILSAGAGGSTKLVSPTGHVERIVAPKYPKEYLDNIDTTCAKKEEIAWLTI